MIRLQSGRTTSSAVLKKEHATNDTEGGFLVITAEGQVTQEVCLKDVISSTLSEN